MSVCAFGPALKAYRESQGMTAAEAASLTGWSVPHIYRIESAAGTLSERTIHRYAEALGAFVTLALVPVETRQAAPLPAEPLMRGEALVALGTATEHAALAREDSTAIAHLDDAERSFRAADYRRTVQLAARAVVAASGARHPDYKRLVRVLGGLLGSAFLRGSGS